MKTNIVRVLFCVAALFAALRFALLKLMSVERALPWARFTDENVWQRIRGSNPFCELRDFARILPKAAATSTLTANREFVGIAEPRSITQFSCPNLSENGPRSAMSKGSLWLMHYLACSVQVDPHS